MTKKEITERVRSILQSKSMPDLDKAKSLEELKEHFSLLNDKLRFCVRIFLMQSIVTHKKIPETRLITPEEIDQIKKGLGILVPGDHQFFLVVAPEVDLHQKRFHALGTLHPCRVASLMGDWMKLHIQEFHGDKEDEHGH